MGAKEPQPAPRGKNKPPPPPPPPPPPKQPHNPGVYPRPRLVLEDGLWAILVWVASPKGGDWQAFDPTNGETRQPLLGSGFAPLNDTVALLPILPLLRAWFRHHPHDSLLVMDADTASRPA
jgi:hypothetical protein